MMINWELAARAAEKDCGAEVNYNEEYFVCPECDEPIFSDDWESEDFMAAGSIVCPICGAIMADHSRIDDLMRDYH